MNTANRQTIDFVTACRSLPQGGIWVKRIIDSSDRSQRAGHRRLSNQRVISLYIIQTALPVPENVTLFVKSGYVASPKKIAIDATCRYLLFSARPITSLTNYQLVRTVFKGKQLNRQSGTLCQPVQSGRPRAELVRICGLNSPRGLFFLPERRREKRTWSKENAVLRTRNSHSITANRPAPGGTKSPRERSSQSKTAEPC